MGLVDAEPASGLRPDDFVSVRAGEQNLGIGRCWIKAYDGLTL